MTTEEERTPCRTVAGLFFGAYFTPLIFMIGLSFLSGNPSAGAFMTMIFAYFPSGLLGLISGSKNLGELTILGYLVYAVVFFLAFRLREIWQTILLWVLLVALLVLNVAGCSSVYERVTSSMTLP